MNHTLFDVDGDLFTIPADVVEKMEREEIRRVKHNQRQARLRRQQGIIPFKEREFLAWDGEGYNDWKKKHHYMLLANSEGMQVTGKSLGTEECLNLILETAERFPNRIHCSFGFNYDVSMILKDLGERFLRILKLFTRVTWRNYIIEHIPRKWFTVMSRGLTVKIYDIHSFFASSFESALENWKIGPWANPITVSLRKRMPPLKKCLEFSESEMIAIFKNLRGHFSYSSIPQVTLYNAIELKYLVLMAEKLRDIFSDAGFDIRSWHGPGALARHALNTNHVKSAMAVCPSDVRIASRYAFAGGRFEMLRGGYVNGKIWNADINSAYPAFAAMLPNLNNGRWRYTRTYEPNTFAIYHIDYAAKQSLTELFPLFRRDHYGNVEFPNRVEGWYWNPEAELVAEDSNATFIEGWIFDEFDSTDRPFAWIQEYYRKRQLLKRIGNPAEFTFKLCINSVYGQLAQRTGWNQKKRTAPRFHQLEWAGWITSKCRAEIYKVAKAMGSDLISVDTDGLYSKCAITGLDFGENLGQWEVTEYDAGIFWQSGMYALRIGDEWIKAKTRGIPKGSYKPEDLLAAFERMESLKLTRKQFIGFGLALNGQMDKWNTWRDEPHEFVFGGKGKRAHNEIACRNGKTCKGTIHGFIPVPHRLNPNETIMSQPHYLPWLDNRTKMTETKESYFDLVLYDSNDTDGESWEVLKNLEKVG